MSEDGLHGAWVLDGGDDAQPVATAGTGQDIEIVRRINAAQVQAGVGTAARRLGASQSDDRDGGPGRQIRRAGP